MGKFLKDFRDFAMRGNVVDMAVGVIIGGAFGKIVTSLVNDIIMPGIGILTSGQNFTDLKFVIQQQVMKGEEVVKPEIAVTYGAFVQTIVDFLIIAFCIFVAIRFMQKLRRKNEVEEAPAAPAGPTQEELLTQIRDLLAKQTEKDASK